MAENVEDTMKLHWKKEIPRRGLGNLLRKVNHIALVVSDVGNSLWFYSDILGFQQIRRPNFDRHGAWLTMGNVELHLILGRPVVHSGDDLIVGHISLETDNIQAVLKYLKENNIPFETNVSVPKGDEAEGIVTQFFLRDPDGYYIELCNCDILTEFCLGNEKLHIEGYAESVKSSTSLNLITKLAVKAREARDRVDGEENIDKEEFFARFKKNKERTDIVVDESILANLVARTKIYGDVCQGETEESLKEILRMAENSAPDAILYMKLKHGDKQMFQPPTIYKNNEEEYKPPMFVAPE